MAAVQSLTSAQTFPPSPPASICETLKKVAEVCCQLAARILFIFAQISIAAYLFPASFHPYVVPIVAFGSALFSGFFFQKDAPIFPCFGKYPLIRPLQVDSKGCFLPGVPLNAPRGIQACNQNCAFSASAQFCLSIPPLVEWTREPIVQEDIQLAPFIEQLQTRTFGADVISAFTSYAQGKPGPIPHLFSDFLKATNLTVPHDLKATFIVQAAYARFFRQYEAAIREGKGVSKGSTQELRLAAHAAYGSISASDSGQTDAGDIVHAVIPTELQAQIRQIHEYHPDSAIERKLQSHDAHTPLILLPMRGNSGPTTISQLFLDYQNNPHVNLPETSSRVEFREPPLFLVFQISRRPAPQEAGSAEKSSGSSGWCSSLCGKLPGSQAKLHNPVELSEEVSITIEGTVHRYRPAAFLEHKGSDNEGHWICGRIVDGQHYLTNNSLVSLVGPDQMGVWKAKSGQACLAAYVRVPD